MIEATQSKTPASSRFFSALLSSWESAWIARQSTTSVKVQHASSTRSKALTFAKEFAVHYCAIARFMLKSRVIFFVASPSVSATPDWQVQAREKSAFYASSPPTPGQIPPLPTDAQRSDSHEYTSVLKTKLWTYGAAAVASVDQWIRRHFRLCPRSVVSTTSLMPGNELDGEKLHSRQWTSIDVVRACAGNGPFGEGGGDCKGTGRVGGTNPSWGAAGRGFEKCWRR